MEVAVVREGTVDSSGSSGSQTVIQVVIDAMKLQNVVLSLSHE
jgi:hypothetical protein